MDSNKKWALSKKEKNKFIDALTPELVVLRTKADISQDELANIIGVSRQTYGAIERKAKRMSWNTYLSLILFYDYNINTHDILRAVGAFPHEMVKRFNGNTDGLDINLSSFIGSESDNIISKLDEQSLNSIKTMIMVEYARCTNTPGSIVIKSFDGKVFLGDAENKNEAAMRAMKRIKEKNQ